MSLMTTLRDGVNKRPAPKPSESEPRKRAIAQELRERFLERVASSERERETARRELGNTALVEDEAGDIPYRIGRYVIIDRLGAGGMGVVYSAYDEALDRCLAIKVLHRIVLDKRERRRERFLREAQAMAKVVHPNLAAVHEVGTEGERLFIAMEFIPGPTLERWLVLEPRSWLEVVAVFRQIAAGLAALHEVGLVHRDVKPSNIIVGDDGRVRVLDLGLVGLDPSEFDSLEDSRSNWISSLSRSEGLLTKTDERLGTPAYMSPEQFGRERLTPASDVFSFCVALYEALYDVHPFLANSFEEVQDNVTCGRIRPPAGETNVPAWLHALVRAGLSIDASERPASMHAIIETLDADPSPRRRRVIQTALASVIAGLIGVLVTRIPAAEQSPVCAGGEVRIASSWAEGRAREVRAKMNATGLPYADKLAARVTAGLSAYAEQWVEEQRQACLDHHEGVNSAKLFDARMRCLDRGRQALETTAELLVNADAGVVEHAGGMLAQLPRLDACHDLSAFRGERQPLLSGERLELRDRLESQLLRSETLAHAGRLEQAIELARAVAERAEDNELPRMQVAAQLNLVRVGIELGAEIDELDDTLSSALSTALREELDELAAEAMIRRFYLRGISPGESERAIADAEVAAAMLERAGDDPELQVLMLTNHGSVALAAGERGRARQTFARALELAERTYGNDHLRLAPLLASLSLVQAEPDARAQLLARAQRIYEERLGPRHPQTLDARMLAAFGDSDPRRALQQLSDLCPQLREQLDAGDCIEELARLHYARGDLDAAREWFARAPALEQPEDPHSALLRAYLRVGQPQVAAELSRVSADLEVEDEPTDGEWWARMHFAERLLVLAHLQQDAGHSEASIRSLERALSSLEPLAPIAHSPQYWRQLALTQAALAQLLADRPPAERGRVPGLSLASREYFEQWPEHYALRLAWLPY